MAPYNVALMKAPPFDPQNFSFLIHDIARLQRREFDRKFADGDISVTPGEARALVHAARAGEVRQVVLAEALGLEAMTLSAYLDRLEKQGLIERIPDPTDRRAKLVRLTDAAYDVLRGIAEKGAEVRAVARDKINDRDWEKLMKLLRQIRSNLHPDE